MLLNKDSSLNTTKDINSNQVISNGNILISDSDGGIKKTHWFRLMILCIFPTTLFLKYYQFFSISGYPFTFFDLNYFLLLFYLVYEFVWLGQSFKIPKTPLLSSLVLIVFVYLFSAINPIVNGSSAFMSQFLKTYLHFIYLVFLGFIFASINISSYEIKAIIKTYIFTSIGVHIFGIYQLFARAFDLPFAFIEYNNILFTLEDQYGVADGVSQLSLHFENFYRATSFFSEPSALGVYSSLILAFLVIPYFSKVKPFIEQKWLFYLATYLALANLLLAFSNTGLFIFTSMLLALSLIDKKIKLTSLLGVLFSAAIFLIIVDQIVNYYTNSSVLGLFYKRIDGIIGYILGDRSRMISGESFDTRADNFKVMINIWTKHPFTGIGMGLIRLSGIYDIRFSEFYVAGVLAELGVQGVLAFTLFFVYLWHYAIMISKNYLKNPNIPDVEKNLYSILLYLVVIVTIINWISANQFINDINWILCGLIFAIVSRYLSLSGQKFYELKIVTTPLKNRLTTNIKKYLEYQQK